MFSHSHLFYAFLVGILLGSCPGLCNAQENPAGTDTARITVDLSRKTGTMNPVWAYFGYDEPNYTHMKNGRKLLAELSKLSAVPVHIRAHNLLNTGNGTASLKWGSTNVYTEDSSGKPVYDWKIMDRIFDTWIQRGIHPYVEIGFTPKALSTHPDPYKHHWQPGDPYKEIYTGWSYPPKDYKKWADLIFHWVRHCVGRYGKDVVRNWQWEVWNEPNIGYWQGTEKEYFKLYDYTVDAVKRALPEAKVGGPATTGPRWDEAAKYLRDFLKHCLDGKNYATGKTGAPLDFISFHAKGSPKMVNGHRRMGIAPELRDVETGFRIVSSFPRFRHLPVVISEADPDGCAACEAKLYPQYGYRNTAQYASYTAAAFSRIYKLAQRSDINLRGILSWSFEFEEAPLFIGFRDLATQGIDKPVLNVFRMFGMMQGSFVQAEDPWEIKTDSILENGVHGSHPDIGVMATKNDHSASIMIWNYDDDALPAPPAKITVKVNHLPENPVLLQQYRIDKNHSNAYQKWIAMGKPKQVSAEQYKVLERAGQLQEKGSPEWMKAAGGNAIIELTLPRQGVSLLKLSW